MNENLMIHTNNNQENAAVTSGISGFVLKMIAIVTMLIDHVAAGPIAQQLNRVADGQESWLITFENYSQWYTIYEWMRGIGRMAFPIFCFLLVEGFLHTKSVWKYTGRLFLFALISEIPFDFALFGSVLEPSYNNVFFTLFLGVLCMAGLKKSKELGERLNAQGNYEPGSFLYWIIAVLIVFAACYGAEVVLKTDYGLAGVLAILMIYMLMSYHRLLAFGAAVLVLALLSSMTELYALLMLIPIGFYNGTRGKQIKYFFYAFYPVHLMILAGISYLLMK